jgi:hypothetical protein
MKKRIRRKPMTAARRKEIERQYVLDTSNIGSLQVVAFGHEALRETFRVWWHPFRGMGPDFDVLCGASVWKPFRRGKTHGMRRVKNATVVSGKSLMLDKLDPPLMRRRMRGEKMIKKRCPVKVRLTIDYPVREKQTKIVTIDRRYPGEIFALLHDFYREIYAEDERRGGKPGPMNNGKGPLYNRGGGPLVWGHDIGDLAIEAVHYRAFAKGDKNGDGAEGEFTFWIGS